MSTIPMMKSRYVPLSLHSLRFVTRDGWETCSDEVMMMMHRFRLAKNFSVKMLIFSYPSVLTYVLGAQKNRLIETVLLCTHNICFG